MLEHQQFSMIKNAQSSVPRAHVNMDSFEPSEDSKAFEKLPEPHQTKRVVNFQLPLNRQILNSQDSDEEEAEERRAKRLKASQKPKSKLLDYLPAPINERAGQVLGSGMSSKSKAMGAIGKVPKGFFDEEDEDDDPVLAAGRGDGAAAAVGLSNEAFKVPDEYDGEGDGVQGPALAPGGSSSHHSASAFAGPSRHEQELDLPPELANVQFKEVSCENPVACHQM
jgi:hypothetical protein